MMVERKGGVKVFDITNRELKTITTIPVNTKYTNAEGESREAEEGLMGVIADPNYENNHWVYLFYADPDTSQACPGKMGINRRFTCQFIQETNFGVSHSTGTLLPHRRRNGFR